MVSKNEIKFIRSLHSGKQRSIRGQFLVEGEKSLVEVLRSSWKLEFVLATPDFLDKYPDFKINSKTRIIETDVNILQNAGTLVTNDAGIAIVAIPDKKEFVFKDGQLVLALENIQDPGNLGTILRVADWYGITDVLLSENSVDVYNPKVIQSSMGSFLRVNSYYEDLKKIFQDKKAPVTGTFPDAGNIYSVDLPTEGFILLGNESQGISGEMLPYIDRRVSIPKFGKAESLNIAVAAAVILDHFMRNRV